MKYFKDKKGRVYAYHDSVPESLRVPNLTEITKEEVDAIHAARKTSSPVRVYPSVPEQLDMIYHDSVDGTNVWRDTIAAVKSNAPKGV
jgi:hypothetical protein